MIRSLFDTPGSVSSLRAYWKSDGFLPDPAALAHEMLGESDRAAIILAASLLDDALKNRITQCLKITATEKQKEDIFAYPGPMGSFSDRTSLAYAFGFIDKDTAKQLNDLRELRNACAHSTKPITFGVTEVLNVLNRIFYPRGTVKLDTTSNKTIKRDFVFEFMFIHNTLIFGSREAGIKSVQDALTEALAELSPSPDKPT